MSMIRTSFLAAVATILLLGCRGTDVPENVARLYEEGVPKTQSQALGATRTLNECRSGETVVFVLKTSSWTGGKTTYFDIEGREVDSSYTSDAAGGIKAQKDWSGFTCTVLRDSKEIVPGLPQ